MIYAVTNGRAFVEVEEVVVVQLKSAFPNL